MTFIERAALVSRIAHGAVGQTRKYTSEPYHHHPTAVAARVRQVKGVTEEMVAAAYLHDVVEDTHLTVDDIAREFGLVVAGYVNELTDQFTDPDYGNRAARKIMEALRLSGISPNAQTIKYADLIDNTASIVEHDPGFAPIYLQEKRQILEGMDQGDPWLYDMAVKYLVGGEIEISGNYRHPTA